VNVFSEDPATGFVSEDELLELSQVFVAGADEAHGSIITRNAFCPSLPCPSTVFCT
jgi:hypothetical protein